MDEVFLNSDIQKAIKLSIGYDEKKIEEIEEQFNKIIRKKYLKYIVTNFVYYQGEDDMIIRGNSFDDIYIGYTYEDWYHIRLKIKKVLNEKTVLDGVFKSLERHECILENMFISDIKNIIMTYISDIYI